jgi:hypothetical protein
MPIMCIYFAAALMREGFGVILSEYLSEIDTNNIASELAPIVEKICSCIRGLSIHDDLRKEMSSAYDNGKFFLKQNNVVSKLMAIANAYDETPDLASAALSAAKALVTTNEAVQILSIHGAVELVFKIVNYQDTVDKVARQLSLVRSAIGLLRNIAADDNKKELFLGMGGLHALLHIISIEPYNQDAILMEHAMACFAQFSLRSPAHSERMVQAGAIETIVKTMTQFSIRDSLQRQGCLAIRNIAGRCPELRSTILDAGAEAALRSAGTLLTVVDEAYAALRDLNCDVQYVKVDEDGSIKPVYEQFGANSGKLNFRPVYDDNDIEQKVAENARAPFASSCDDEDCGDHHHHH